MKECFVEQLFEGNHILAMWFTREIILCDKVPFYSNKKILKWFSCKAILKNEFVFVPDDFSSFKIGALLSCCTGNVKRDVHLYDKPKSLQEVLNVNKGRQTSIAKTYRIKD
ncbi:hypothetical protein T02_11895 [Trichinella nativa]|uniref:Uncharacterized protein n=1 Tax=Trichinella nativa TaxID=6335 RepID=A0A0V1KTD0_9BILA|nr:hypothetical protein T02_11895 [Trichinella nativa]